MSIIFLILAISMFGLFEMTLPSSWINRLQQFNDKQKGGTVTGVFLMGVISAVIASPCTTAPLAGALMFIMKDGDMIRGGAYLFVMGLGMGVPLAIIALLGQKFLPKSGMWMKNIKVLCGFIMLTIPLYLLRAYLSTEIITAIAILMSGSLICYLTLLVMKKQRGPFAIFTMTVTAAMAAASLFMTPDDGSDNLFEQVKTLDELESVIRDNDVVIVDIRADWCASCKKYEDTTFADRNVIEYMSGFKNVYVDITEDNAPSKDIIEKYNSAITGAPTVLIFKNHTLISSVNGYLPAGSFMARINSALKKDR
jgi:thiol:disulfide interchange protein DsbD